MLFGHGWYSVPPGRGMIGQSPSLVNFFARFSALRVDLSAHYLGQFSTAVGLLDRWRGSPVTLTDLTQELLTGFLGYLQNRGSAPATVNTRRKSLLLLWQAASVQGLVDPPPVIPKLTEPGRLPVAWTVTELERLIACARALTGDVGSIPRRYWWPSLLLGIWSTSARVSSLLATKTEDCNLGERYLILRAENTKSRRDSLKHLTDQATASIAAHYDAARPLVWPWPYNRRYLWHFFRRRIVEPAGLQASSRGMSLFHKIRRSGISYLAAVDPELARQQADHRDLRTTQRHYIDPTIACRRNAADELPRLDV